jgi:hypothetical protein
VSRAAKTSASGGTAASAAGCTVTVCRGCCCGQAEKVEVILRDHDLVLRPHVAVPLERVRDNGTAPGSG